MVMVSATMSTTPFSTACTRWPVGTATKWMSSGVPKMAWLTCRSMSMSNPLYWPLFGSR
jgi:hypothetical protein